MIQAESGWTVLFHNKEDDENFTLRVVAWDKDGNPMVVDENAKRLVRADLHSGGEVLQLRGSGISSKKGPMA